MNRRGQGHRFDNRFPQGGRAPPLQHGLERDELRLGFGRLAYPENGSHDQNEPAKTRTPQVHFSCLSESQFGTNARVHVLEDRVVCTSFTEVTEAGARKQLDNARAPCGLPLNLHRRL